MIDIYHQIYTGVETCLYFAKYIQKKFEKFRDKYGKKYLIYSIGHDYTAGIRVISLVHLWDEFNPKTAKDIITGRIARERGDIPGRIKYSEALELNEKTGELELVGLPPYIEVLE